MKPGMKAATAFSKQGLTIHAEAQIEFQRTVRRYVPDNKMCRCSLREDQAFSTVLQSSKQSLVTLTPQICILYDQA
jgi:hypothetical protein